MPAGTASHEGGDNVKDQAHGLRLEWISHMSRDHDVYIVAGATAQRLLSSQSIYLPAPPLRPLLLGALSLCEISLPVTQSITLYMTSMNYGVRNSYRDPKV